MPAGPRLTFSIPFSFLPLPRPFSLGERRSSKEGGGIVGSATRVGSFPFFFFSFCKSLFFLLSPSFLFFLRCFCRRDGDRRREGEGWMAAGGVSSFFLSVSFFPHSFPLSYGDGHHERENRRKRKGAQLGIPVFPFPLFFFLP